ncbi:type II secretion system F family protein [Candidatus Roizmanbacteria bacterium]|nr:type II secretion system F family protein [Candidatus Roizmanbacteria bacterium]
MQFTYRVKDNEGKVLTGSLSANTQEDAIKMLRDRSAFILSIEEQSETTMQIDDILARFSRVGFAQIVEFTRQLATMLNAGLSLVESLSLLEQEAQGNPAFKKIVNDVLGEIKGGGTLAKALAKHPNHFNKIYTALVSAGEESGKLDTVLLRLADNLEAERSFRAQVKTALIYPTIVVIGMVALATMMMVYVVPQLTEIYESFDVELPLTTQMMIATSNFIINFWWAILIALAGIIFWIPQFKRSEMGVRIIDMVTLNLPVWGSLKKDTIMTELTRTLSLLISAGVPILESLEIVAEALPSQLYSNGIRDAAKKVERGFQLGSLLSSNPIYPPIFGQMVTVGEQTGKMDETLGRISLYFESSASEKVKRLTASLEPIILGVLGVGVGFLVFSIVMPMYQLTQAF